MVKLQARIYPTIHEDFSLKSLNCGQQFVGLSRQSLPPLEQLLAKKYILMSDYRKYLEANCIIQKLLITIRKKTPAESNL